MFWILILVCLPMKRWMITHFSVITRAALAISRIQSRLVLGRCVYGTTQDNYDIHGGRLRLCDCRTFNWCGL